MATVPKHLDRGLVPIDDHGSVLRPDQEAIRDLEYHALMGVCDADTPAHFHSFAREVIETAFDHRRPDDDSGFPPM